MEREAIEAQKAQMAEETIEARKVQLVEEFRRLYHAGTVNLFEGNLSVRCGDTVLMTPSQQSKETMTPDMIVALDLAGNLLCENGYRPSSEAGMHLELYRLRPDIGAVVHTHSAFATAFALTGQAISGNLAETHLVFGGEVPCCAYGTPGTPAVYAEFGRVFGQEGRDAALLANHGLVCVGRTLEDALAKAEAAEKLAKITWLARALGDEAPLPEDATDALLARWAAGRK